MKYLLLSLFLSVFNPFPTNFPVLDHLIQFTQAFPQTCFPLLLPLYTLHKIIFIHPHHMSNHLKISCFIHSTTPQFTKASQSHLDLRCILYFSYFFHTLITSLHFTFLSLIQVGKMMLFLLPFCTLFIPILIFLICY